MIDLKFKRVINAPINQVWNVIAGEFTEAHKWAAGTPKCRKGTKAEGYDRVCETESGTLKDTIIKMDKDNYLLEFSVEGLPFFVRSVVSTWTLKKISDTQTELTMGPRIDVIPVIGTILQFPMKIALNKLYPELLNDLAIYTETGKPSPRKQKELDKATV